jgi:hypothetical protein
LIICIVFLFSYLYLISTEFHLLYKKIKFLIININIDDLALYAGYILVIIKGDWHMVREEGKRGYVYNLDSNKTWGGIIFYLILGETAARKRKRKRRLHSEGGGLF